MMEANGVSRGYSWEPKFGLRSIQRGSTAPLCLERYPAARILKIVPRTANPVFFRCHLKLPQITARSSHARVTDPQHDTNWSILWIRTRLLSSALRVSTDPATAATALTFGAWCPTPTSSQTIDRLLASEPPSGPINSLNHLLPHVSANLVVRWIDILSLMHNNCLTRICILLRAPVAPSLLPHNL